MIVEKNIDVDWQETRRFLEEKYFSKIRELSKKYDYPCENIAIDFNWVFGLIEKIENQPKTDWIPCEDVLSMSESDFITHILSTICDYAKVNNYEITETVKAMGENLIALTEIANFDKWKEGVTDDE